MQRMQKFLWISLLMIVMVLISACGTANSVSAVTALPTITATGTTNDLNTDLPEKDELTSTPEATSILEVTATAFEEDQSDTTEADANTNNNTSERQTGVGNMALATFTPAPNKLEPGVARSIALATDTAMQPEIEEPLTFDESPVSLTFDEFYSGFSIRTGLQSSEKLKSLDGQRVVIEGYVAPPLRPRLDFFVLTKIALAFCPFCSTDVEWPDDIALIYLPEQQLISSEHPVRITGTLEIGSSVDAETGMVSLVRIYAEEMETLD